MLIVSQGNSALINSSGKFTRSHPGGNLPEIHLILAVSSPAMIKFDDAISPDPNVETSNNSLSRLIADTINRRNFMIKTHSFIIF